MVEQVQRVGWTLVCALLLAFLVSGCVDDDSSDSNTVVQHEEVGQTPEEVIRDYFLAVGRHDDETIDALSSSYLRKARLSWADDDTEVRYDMSNLTVTPTGPADDNDLASRPERYQDYFAVRNGRVDYVMLDDSMTSMAGPQLRFVTVVKETESSPWRVEEIGTGP